MCKQPPAAGLGDKTPTPLRTELRLFRNDFERIRSNLPLRRRARKEIFTKKALPSGAAVA